MRLIDADSVYKWYLEAFKGQIKPNEIRFSMNDIRGNLENIQTVDAVQVIRCRDCKYNLQNPRKWADNDKTLTYVHCGFMSEDDYCSKAVRKENDRQTDN